MDYFSEIHKMILKPLPAHLNRNKGLQQTIWCLNKILKNINQFINKPIVLQINRFIFVQ